MGLTPRPRCSRPFRSTAARAGTSTAQRCSGRLRRSTFGEAGAPSAQTEHLRRSRQHPRRSRPGEWYIWRFMLSLNLAKIRDAKERFEQVYSPGQLAAGDEAFRVAAPVTLA